MKTHYLIVLFLLLLGSCKKDSIQCHDDEYNPWQQDFDHYVPYGVNQNDTVRFKHYVDSVLVDTMTLTFDKIIIDTAYVDEHVDGYGNGRYCYSYIYGARKTWYFKGNKPEDTLQIQLVATAYNDAYLYVIFKKQILEDLTWRINSPSTYNGYIQEITFDSTTYTQVNYFGKRGACKCFDLFYTTYKGIIRMKLFNREVWQRID
jgi:hypothetical protein